MLKLIARRLFSGVILLIVVSSLAFFLIYLTGGDVARNLLGEFATEEQIAQRRAQLGLDRPLLERFADWLGHAVTGDLGTSWVTSQPVATAVAGRLPVTLSLVIICIVVTAILATLLGIAAAQRRGWVDRLVQVLSILGFAIPGFVVALGLVTVFAVQLRIFPATGFTPFAVNPGLWALSLVLPVTALVLAAVASTAQQVRSAIIDVQGRDFVRTLRSRGIGEGEIAFRHVLRNAAPAGLTVLSLQFVSLLGGAVVVEQIFALPGIGSLAVDSTAQGDLPVIMGIIVYIVILVVIVNLVVDICNGWLIPKARA